MFHNTLLLLVASLSATALAGPESVSSVSADASDASDIVLDIDALSTPTLEYKAASTASSVTTLETCDPLKSTGCSADKALATSIYSDFTEQDDHYEAYHTSDEIFYTDDGLQLTLAKRFDNPSIVSDFYIMFGKVEVWLKSAEGQGIISSFYLQSDDLDEIDMEFFGGGVNQMQSNFFSKGDTTTYDRGEYHLMSENPRTDYHNYTLDWNEESLTWYIDGEAVRTLQNNTSSGYPQTPMRIFAGIWAGGDSSNAAGTIEWAGGATDYADAPFSMYIQSLVVSDYSTGTEYSYGDDSGSWESIVAKNGKVNGRQAEADVEFAALVEKGSTSDLSKRSTTTTASSVNSSAAQTSTTVSSSSLATTLSTSTTSSSEEDSSTAETTTDEKKTTATTSKSSVSSVSESKTIKTVVSDSGAQVAGSSGLLALALVVLNLF